MKMSMGDYAGLTTDQKVVAVLVEIENIKTDVADIAKFVKERPCPSDFCRQCRSDVEMLKGWKIKRETELSKQEEEEDDERDYKAWFWPLLISTILSVIGFFGLMIWG